MQNLEELQKEYYEFVKKTPPEIQNIINGKDVLKVEKEFLEEFKPKRVLDIGCGNGERIFPYYEKIGCDFLGIEREESLIKNSKYSHKIINGDITDKDFLPPNFEYDLIALWGVIISAITDEKRKFMWSNIEKLIKRMKKPALAFTTITSFDWFKDSLKGKVVRIHNTAPPQYFPSEKELHNIFTELKIKLSRTYSDDKITLYYLTR
ncbi:MAG: class I SAM-dependent methyltransferase [Brevinematales bacterium]